MASPHGTRCGDHRATWPMMIAYGMPPFDNEDTLLAQLCDGGDGLTTS